MENGQEYSIEELKEQRSAIVEEIKSLQDQSSQFRY
jgi:hypothetical protein